MNHNTYLEEITVSIQIDGSLSGAGIICEISNLYYVITAAHVIYGKKYGNSIVPSQVSVNYLGNNYDISKIYTSENFREKDIDISALKIDKFDINIRQLNFLKTTIPDCEYKFRGFPNLDEKSRLGKNFSKYYHNGSGENFVEIIKGNTSDFQHLIQGKDSDMDGISGSGIITFFNNEPYLYGVLKGFRHSGAAFCELDIIPLTSLKTELDIEFKQIIDINLFLQELEKFEAEVSEKEIEQFKANKNSLVLNLERKLKNLNYNSNYNVIEKIDFHIKKYLNGDALLNFLKENNYPIIKRCHDKIMSSFRDTLYQQIQITDSQFKAVELYNEIIKDYRGLMTDSLKNKGLDNSKILDLSNYGISKFLADCDLDINQVEGN